MAFEKTARRRNRRSAVRRAWLYSFFLSLPGLIFAAYLFYRARLTAAPVILLGACLLLYFLLLSAALIESLVRPLQTLSNVVASLREGDYSFRARAGPDRRMR